MMEEQVALETFFNMMITEEHSAQKKYELMQEFTSSPELKKLLARIAAEEQMHGQLLESELMKLEKK
jgi:rubrerythrin